MGKIAIDFHPQVGEWNYRGEPPVGPSEIPLLMMPDVKTRELQEMKLNNW